MSTLVYTKGRQLYTVNLPLKWILDPTPNTMAQCNPWAINSILSCNNRHKKCQKWLIQKMEIFQLRKLDYDKGPSQELKWNSSQTLPISKMFLLSPPENYPTNPKKAVYTWLFLVHSCDPVSEWQLQGRGGSTWKWMGIPEAMTLLIGFCVSDIVRTPSSPL